MNYKSVFLGSLAAVAAALLGGFLIGLYAGTEGISYEWLLHEYPWLVYALNILAGLMGGLVTFKLTRTRLALNILVMSTTVLVLSVIANYPSAQYSSNLVQE